MAYRFGQLRRNQIQNYMTPISYENCDNNGSVLSFLETVSPVSDDTVFLDKAIYLSNGLSFEAVDEVGKQKCYYCRFQVKKDINYEQIITIQLYNKTSKTSKDTKQTFKTITVPKGLDNEFVVFDVVIAPNGSYNRLEFLLNRTSTDYSTNFEQDGKTYHGRVIDVRILQLNTIYNVINTLIPYMNEADAFKQIGVQSAPGLQMCIDGEEIRVGRSGIYEINHGVNVNFMGFILQPDDGKKFILDYQY